VRRSKSGERALDGAGEREGNECEGLDSAQDQSTSASAEAVVVVADGDETVPLVLFTFLSTLPQKENAPGTKL